MKDEDFCVPEAEEVIEDCKKKKSLNPWKTWFCQMAWMPPTLKKCPLAKDCLRERRFHREAPMLAV